MNREIHIRGRGDRRGFVTLLALGTMALVVAAAADVSLAVGADFLRTRQAANEAQLRQLLLAGCEAARQEIADGHAGGPVAMVALPEELKSLAATLTVTPADGNNASDATMTIAAQCGGHRASERVVFHHGDGGWALAGVAVDR